jgi:O-antigen ligase
MRRIDVSLLICLALFALLALATSVTGLFHSQTLSQAGVLTFMFGFLALTLSKRWTSPEIIRGDLAVGFIVVCLAQAVGLVGLAARQPWAIADYGRFQGLFSNANYAGATSVIGIVVGSYIIQTMVGARRWLVLLGMLTLAGATLASGSRGALVALAAGVMTAFLVVAKRRFVLMSIGAALVLVVTLTVLSYTLPSVGGSFNRALQGSDITSGRLQIYTDLLTHWSRMPWFGTGYRTTELLTGPHRLTGHNTYLSVLTEMGIAGAAVFFVLLVLIIRAGPAPRMNRALLGAVVTVLVIEITESYLFGWGSPIPLLEWLTLLAFPAIGHTQSQRGASAVYAAPTPPSGLQSSSSCLGNDGYRGLLRSATASSASAARFTENSLSNRANALRARDSSAPSKCS